MPISVVRPGLEASLCSAITMTKTRLSFSQAFSNLLEQLPVRLWQFNARILNDRLDLAVDVERWNLRTV